MRYALTLGASLAVALLACSAFAEEKQLKSGPQPGSTPTPFNPLHATGPDEGQKLCLV